MSVGGNASDVVIETRVSGSVQIGGDLTGVLRIAGNNFDSNALSGRVEIGGSLLGPLEVEKEVAGTSGQPSIEVGGNLGAEIRLYASLYDDPNALADILVHGTRGSAGAIAVDWDGYDPNNEWRSGAVIHVDQTDYLGNSRAGRVYEITCLKADMNNDGEVSYGDINPFVLALTYPEVYAQDYPGLAGSLVYHIDCNCDEQMSYGDINAFVLRLNDPNEYYAQYPCCELCEPCELMEAPSGGGTNEEARTSPQVVAGQLLLNIDPDLYDDLVEIVAQAAAGLDDAGERAYWLAVYGYLAE